jgi:Dolichyl-phosphate-mannose-protein mannosyltransferase
LLARPAGLSRIVLSPTGLCSYDRLSNRSKLPIEWAIPAALEVQVTQDISGDSAPKHTGLGAISGFFESHRRAFALLLLILVACAATAQSALKPFWWDELASYDIAQLPRVSDVWSFFRAGLDTPSPMPTLIVHATLRLIGSSEVLVRTPFEAGFLLMCLCLFGITARRYGAGYALSALLLPAMSGTFYYASELRTYGIILGAIAFAIYCWQGIDSGGTARRIRIPGVFAGLAAAILCHLFSIFVLIPFTLAQLVRDRRTHRLDIPVWAALVLSPLCLLIELPGMEAAHRTYAGAFWSKPHSGEILFSYSYSLGIGWMIAVMAILMAWPALERRFSELADPAAITVKYQGFDAAEWTLIGSLATLPWFAWPLSHFVGVYVPRYVLPLTIGVALIVVGGVAEALKRNRLAGVALSLAFLLIFVHDKRPEISHALHIRGSLASALQREPMIQALEESPLPIVAPNTPAYTQLQHYLPAQLEQRLYYTLNTPDAIRPEEDRDAELSMRLFSTRLPLRVEEFATFASEHPSFLLVVKNPLEHSGVSGNLSVRWIGNYSGAMQFGFSPFSVYQVDVIAKP